MIKKGLFLFAAIMCLAFVPVSCEEPLPVNPDEEQGNNEEEHPKVETPVKLQKVKCTVEAVGDNIFDQKPEFTLQLKNPNEVAVKVQVKVTLKTDKGSTVETVTDSVEVAALGTNDYIYTPTENLVPGFYTARCAVNGITAKDAAFGISPFEIISAPDMQDDFNEYWENAKAQLPELKEGETVSLQEIKSTDSYKIYKVEIHSVPNEIDGDPVVIRGFYVEPQDGKKHPVLMHFFGWDDRRGSVRVPSGANGEYTEFYLSNRGQYHNNRAAAYEMVDTWIAEHGEWQATDPCKYASILDPNDEYNWFGFNFGIKDGFYYRGAFLDCVQAVRFMATREASDMDNLFAEGSSQGGAYSYAAAALSDYQFTAIAPCVAFLGDYPDYFELAGWPGNVAKANQGSMTDEEMYAFLSYFDTKNLATRISCAVIACSNLKDGTCPPHTNTAPYNNLNTQDKEMHYYPDLEHVEPADWAKKYNNFFKARMK